MKTMSYRYDREKKTRRNWYIAGTIFLIIALFTPVYQLFFDVFETGIENTWKNKTALENESRSWLSVFSSKKKLAQENEQLRAEIARLEVEALRTRYLADNQETITQIQSVGLMPAFILENGVLGARDTLVISQGSLDGVSIGDEVYVDGYVLVGEVTVVYESSAIVTLYSDTGLSIEGRLYPRDVTLIAKGYGNGSLFIDTPREVEVTEGDILYSLQDPGAIVGIVRSVEFDARNPFKQVYLSYPTNRNTWSQVGIRSN